MTSNSPLSPAVRRLADQLFPRGSLICLHTRDHASLGFAAARWATDIDDFSAKVARCPTTWSIYWSFATFKTRGQRIGANVDKVHALTIDIDVHGKPHEHKTLDEAAHALSEFIRQYTLPAPWIISSGRGLHVYWTLTEGLTAEQWSAANDRICQAARAAGVKVDTAAVGTANALLRVPGSWHPGANVAAGVRSRGTPAVLADLLAPLPVTTAPVHRQVVEKDPIFANIPIAKSQSEFYPTRSDLTPLSLMVSECKQVRTAPTGRYSQWYLALQLALSAGDEDAARAWSVRDATYDADMAAFDRKLAGIDRKRDESPDRVLPVLCITLENANPDGCVGCRFKGSPRVRTPFGVGDVPPPDKVPPQAAPPTPAIAVAVATGSGGIALFTPVAEDAPIPYAPTDEDPYYVENGTPFWRRKVSRDTDEAMIPPPVRLAHFSVVPLIHEHSPSGGVNRTVWRVKRNGRQEDIDIPDTVLAGGGNGGKAITEYMAGRSCVISDPTKSKHFGIWMGVYFNQALDRLPVRVRANAMGWQPDGSFVTAHAQYTADHRVQAPLLSPAAEAERRLVGPSKGTAEQWGTIPALYARQKNMAALFGVMQGFASPLLNMAGQMGLIVHLHSAESGTGKTTVQKVVNSIYGHPERQMKGFRDTVNASFVSAAARGNLAVTRDEITKLSGAAVSDYALSITQGHDKARLDKDSNAKESGNWSLIALTSANISLRDKLAANKRADAEAESMRIIEIPFAYPAMEAGDRVIIDNTLEACYGVAIETYAPALVARRADIYTLVQAALIRWENEPPARGHSAQRFWLADFAAVEVAHSIATDCGLISFPWADLKAYILDVVWPHQLKENRATKETHASKDILPALMESLQARSVKRAVGTAVPEYPVDMRNLLGTWYTEGNYIDVSATAVREFIRKDPSEQTPRDLLAQWAKLPRDGEYYLHSAEPTVRDIDIRVGGERTKAKAFRFYLRKDLDPTTTEGD